MSQETLFEIDYRTLNLRGLTYQITHPENPPHIDRGLGAIRYKAKVIRLRVDYKVDKDFPWNSVDSGFDYTLGYRRLMDMIFKTKKKPDNFELADATHLAAVREKLILPSFKRDGVIFAIGRPRPHSKGLLVGCLPSGENHARDFYLPEWTSGEVAIPSVGNSKSALEFQAMLNSKGFPAGTGFLVVSRVAES